MPELPEVEIFVRELAPELAGRTIVAARVFWPRTVAAPTVEEFPARLAGLRFDLFDRRGKYMLLGLSDGSTLIVHLRMTGKLRMLPGDAPPDKHTHVVLDLDDGRSVHYTDPRKFGRIWLVDDPAQVVDKLGPEPLDEVFSPAGLAARLAGRSASIKALLLDQRIVAGVGNIYADEALFRAKLHPARPGGSLTLDEIARLYEAVRFVLAKGIDLRGSSLGGSVLQNYLPPSGKPGGAQEDHQVFRRTGQPCLVCGTPIARIVLAQRSTHFCPTCQPVGEG
jgi:formamidopyrimidine-DNA glycosylase